MTTYSVKDYKGMDVSDRFVSNNEEDVIISNTAGLYIGPRDKMPHNMEYGDIVISAGAIDALNKYAVEGNHAVALGNDAYAVEGSMAVGNGIKTTMVGEVTIGEYVVIV